MGVAEMAARAASHSWPASQTGPPRKRAGWRTVRRSSDAAGSASGREGSRAKEADICLAWSPEAVDATGTGLEEPEMLWRAVRSAREVVRKKSSDKSAKLGSRIRRTEISEVDRIGAAREAPGSGSGKLVGGGMWGRWTPVLAFARICSSRRRRAASAVAASAAPARRRTGEPVKRKDIVGSNVYSNTKSEYKIIRPTIC